MRFDPNSLTIDDLMTLESAGVDLSDLASVGKPGPDGQPTVPKASVLRALAWVLGRVDEPTMTLEDAGRLTFAQVTALADSVEAGDSDPE